MLSPTSPFSESQLFNNSPYSSTEPFILMLHDDDHVGLRIPPKALHNHPSVPRLLSFKKLVNMAVVVDKYDCLHATRMYGDSWMKRWMPLAEKLGYEKCLFVARIWGVEKLFGSLFRRVAAQTYPEGRGRYG